MKAEKLVHALTILMCYDYDAEIFFTYNSVWFWEPEEFDHKKYGHLFEENGWKRGHGYDHLPFWYYDDIGLLISEK